MAGSRLDKIGTIFTRIGGLLRCGVIKDVDKPIWFDVYKAFPPKIEPKFNRPLPKSDVKNLIYPEDFFRARFYKIYGSPGIVDVCDPKSESISEKFVNECFRLYKDNMSEEALFKMSAASLKSQGIVLRTLAEIRDEKNKEDQKSLRKKIQQSVHDNSSGNAKTLTAKELFGDILNRKNDEDFVLEDDDIWKKPKNL